MLVGVVLSFEGFKMICGALMACGGGEDGRETGNGGCSGLRIVKELLSHALLLDKDSVKHWKWELVFQPKDLKKTQIKTYRFLIIHNCEIKLKFPDHMMAF